VVHDRQDAVRAPLRKWCRLRRQAPPLAKVQGPLSRGWQRTQPDRSTAEVDSLLKQLDNYWKSSKDYYDDDEHCRGRNYFWDAPDLQCDY
jgi:hypothetical protein